MSLRMASGLWASTLSRMAISPDRGIYAATPESEASPVRRRSSSFFRANPSFLSVLPIDDINDPRD